jgi:glycosyltransferase involved in cell wall biosynthesis
MASLFGLGGSMSGGLATPFGKPILTSKSTRLLEFTDEVNCKKFNSDQLAETVMNVYKDKEMQKKISEGALNMAQELSAEKSAKRIVELYQKCLSKTCQ